MSLLDYKVFYIFFLYLRVVLSIIETSLMGTRFSKDKTLTRYHHCTISTWVQSENSIAEWLQHIRNKSIQAPWHPPIFTLNHPPTLEASTCPTKRISYKNCTQFDFLPLELLHNIDMLHVGLVHCNELNSVLVILTQHHPVLCASTAYELKYSPFD